MHGLVQIAPLPPVPLHDLFTYRVPELLRPHIQPGMRVRMPLGRQTRTGVVAGFADAAPPGELRPILEVLDADPFVPPELLELCRWTAGYYLASLADVLATVVPVSLPAPANERVVRLVRRLTADEEATLARRAPARGRAYRVLCEAPGGELGVAAARAAGVSTPALRTLVAAGVAEAALRPRPRPPATPGDATPRLPLTATQRAALDAIAAPIASGEPASFLLHGVTGSGKTEVFLAAAERTLAAGRGVLLLVPEIALTHQLVDRVRARLGDAVAVLHSGLGPRERRKPRARGPDARVPQPAGLRGISPVSRLRHRRHLPALQRDPHVAPGGARARVPSLPSPASSAAGVPGVRRATARGVRRRHRAGRGRSPRRPPARRRRPARPRCRAARRRPAAHPRALAGGRHRHPRRHADGEQGPRRPRRDARRRSARGSRAQRAGLPRRRADVPAPRAGRGARRPGRRARPRDRPDVPSRPSERRGRGHPRLQGLHGPGARASARARLPAVLAAGEPSPGRPGRRRRRARRARPRHPAAARGGAPRARRRRRPRSGAAAGRAGARPVPLAPAPP